MAENENVFMQAASARDEYGLVQMANLVASCRSFRRFDEGRRVPEGFLLELVDMARLCANGANRQLLRFRVVSDPAACDAVFAELAWAGYFKDWAGPAAGERPTGYVVIAAEHGAAGKPVAPIAEVDCGIAAQTMMLAARSAAPSYAGCMLKAFTPRLIDVLGLDAERYELKLVCAFGLPAEEVRLEPLSASPDGSIKYWRDDAGVHHVPKRSLEDVLI